MSDIAIRAAECHAERPLYASGLCEACYKREWRKSNPSYKDRARFRRATDIEYRDRNNANARRRRIERLQTEPEYRERHNGWARKSRNKTEYGLSEDAFNAMLHNQNGLCVISGEGPGSTKSESLVVDHCHDTGMVRGLIKCRYNRALGLFNHSPELLRAAADYLERYTQ